MYYEVKMTRIGECANSGKTKRFNELYLVDAITMYEAITKFEAYIQQYYPEHETVSVRRTLFAEIIDNIADGTYYHAKTNIITIDEGAGKERKVPYHMLIRAANFDDAKMLYEQAIKEWFSDTSLGVIKDTNIIEYIK